MKFEMTISNLYNFLIKRWCLLNNLLSGDFSIECVFLSL